MPQVCTDYTKKIHKTGIGAQTLFLGASVADFNTNMGWGGQRSQLSVKLVEDNNCFTENSLNNQFPWNNTNYNYDYPNHYVNCETNEDCYIDEEGKPYNEQGQKDSSGNWIKRPSREKVVPGKVYYNWNLDKNARQGQGGFVSRYWRRPDPGFFANTTHINLDGRYDEEHLYSYDIINCPVFFRMGEFSFAGLVQSWEENYDSGGLVYNLNIESIDTILNQSYIILDKHAGSIYSNTQQGDFYGGPSSFLESYPNIYKGNIQQGNLPNVFNVYGFLESFGINNFGGSEKNDNGISANLIVESLKILTSTVVPRDDFGRPLGPPTYNLFEKKAFSPFGRILLKVPQTEKTYLRISESFSQNMAMGLLPVTRDENGVQRHHVMLDLSEMPALPYDYRISESVISIMSLIQKITTDTGCDFYFDIIPANIDNNAEIVIKLKTIYRSVQQDTNQIKNTIKQFENSGIPVSSSRLGKEKNVNNSRVMYIGANQQRLYQAKSYRLAYTQSNYIYNSITGQFVEFYSYNSNASKFAGTIRDPNILSTRNHALSTTDYGPLLDINDKISRKVLNGPQTFGEKDLLWKDLWYADSVPQTGNYNKSTKIPTEKATDPLSVATTRFFPLFEDVIAPFMGYKAEEDINTGLTDSTNNILRRIRPVWMDNWTGQIIVLVEASELPKTLNVPVYSPYPGSSFFMISESEIRSAMAGFDSFVSYCLGKIFKPDLYASLYNSYASRGLLNSSGSQIFPASPAVPVAPSQSIPATIPPAPGAIFADETSGVDGAGSSNDTVSAQSENVEFKSMASAIFEDGADPGNVTPNTSNISTPFGTVGEVSPMPGVTVLNNTDMLGNLNFLKDLKSLCDFIANIGNAHYGKTYMVRVPEVSSYKDTQYSNVKQLEYGSDKFSVYTGSGKTFYNYEPTNDGAWEEFGNFIDDNILIGSPSYYALSDDSGKVKPILGYNATDSFDYFTNYLCKNPALVLAMQASNLDQGDLDISVSQAELGFLAGKCNDLIYPSIDVAKLDPGNFVIKNSPVRHLDQHGTYYTAIANTSKRLYHTANLRENFDFLDPENMRFPRVIVETQGNVTLNSNANSFGSDPNLTVLSTASLEDLCLYLRNMNSPLTIGYIDWDFVSMLLSRNSSVTGNASIALPNVMESSASYQQMVPKAAHPYFAAIPLKSNTYTYGPWINYPHFDKNVIFPDAGVYADNAIENLIGGISIEVDDTLAPWQYGGMDFLDQAVLSKIYNEIQYQQITETATLSIPGLPIFGLASNFYYGGNIDTRGYLVHNSQLYSPQITQINKTENIVNRTLSSTIPRVGNPTGNPIADYLPEYILTKISKTYPVQELRSFSDNRFAPIISDISCSVSPQSVETRYSFRTYLQKLGFFNKENGDRLKQAGLNNIKRNKQLADISRSLNNKIINEIEKVKTEKANIQALNNFDSGFFGTSPTECLIGANAPTIKTPIDYSLLIKSIRSGDNSDPFERYRLSIGSDVGEPSTEEFQLKPFHTLLDLRTNRTLVGNYMNKEAIGELRNNYANKSAMSLDGIFSPVSFYPTKNNSTFSLRKYFTKHCSLCQGTGLINLSTRQYKNRDVPSEEALQIKCPNCSIKKQELASSSTTSSASNETLPPYIITNDNDFNTILEFDTSNLISTSSSAQVDNTKSIGINIPINQISLQPILVPYGEFKNSNTQEDDRARHSIRIVGRGEIAQKNPLSLDIGLNQNHYFSKDGQYVKMPRSEVDGHNLDYYGIDILAKNHRNNKTGFSYLMNQRFFGLRGPFVLHGWGYDMEGYPVPNESDEPKIIDKFGRPARFLLKVNKIPGNFTYDKLNDGDAFYLAADETTVDTDPDQLVYYNKRNNLQIYDNTENNWRDILPTDKVKKIEISNDLEKTPNFTEIDEEGYFVIGENYKNRGDIITKQYSYSGSKWVKGPRSDKFYKNFGERSDLWPVGPVDLRWDESRGVWTIKSSTSPYKMVYITLEEDLVREEDFDETYPARGFLDDIEYSKEPLPNGFRRLVYVKDKTGFTAPKGVKLLCRYDIDTGYYEPVSKPSIIAHGTTGTGNSAIINMHYAQGGRSGSPPELTITFENPLEFSLTSGKHGIFSYINGKWNLTAINN